MEIKVGKMSSFDIYVFRKVGRAVGGGFRSSPERDASGEAQPSVLGVGLPSPCREARPILLFYKGPPLPLSSLHGCLRGSMSVSSSPCSVLRSLEWGSLWFLQVPARKHAAQTELRVRYLWQSWAGLTLFKALPCLMTGTQS